MAFMRAVVYTEKEFFLISEDLEEVIFMKYQTIPMIPVGEYHDEDAVEDEELADDLASVWAEFPRVHHFEVVEKYYGYLGANGYMDRTDYVLGDSPGDVAQQLLDLYFDGDPEYMDEGDKEDVAFLEGIVEEERQEALGEQQLNFGENRP